MTMTVVTVTLNPAIDKSCSVDQVAPDRKLRCSQPAFDPGGGGINVARVIRRLGGDTLALWTCGGPMGELLAGLLDEEGVPHQPVHIAGLTRENFIVFERTSEQQYRFGTPGPPLAEDEAERCLQQVRSLDPAPEFLVLSGSLPPGLADDFYGQLIRQASKSSRVVLDASGPALTRGLTEPVFLIKPNLRELGQLAGHEIEDESQIREVAQELIGDGRVQVVVTSLGSAGAVLVTSSGAAHISAPTVPIRSKVGAGDSTVAGIVFGLAQGRSLFDAVRLGIAAGAAAVMTEGTELCRRSDTERLDRDMAHQATAHTFQDEVR